MIIIPVPEPLSYCKNCVIKSVLKKQMRKHNIDCNVEIDNGVIVFNNGKQSTLLDAMKIENIWC